MKVISLGTCMQDTAIQYVVVTEQNCVVAAYRQDLETQLIYDISFCTTLPYVIEQVMEIIKK